MKQNIFFHPGQGFAAFGREIEGSPPQGVFDTFPYSIKIWLEIEMSVGAKTTKLSPNHRQFKTPWIILFMWLVYKIPAF